MVKFRSAIISLSIISLFLLMSQRSQGNNIELFPVTLDSLPEAESNYQGYRLHLANITVIKQKADQVKLRYTAINTGRENLRLGKSSSQDLETLVIGFEESFENSNLYALKAPLVNAVQHQDLVILAGDIRRGLEVNVTLSRDQLAASPPINKVLSKKIKVKETTPTTAESTAATTQSVPVIETKEPEIIKDSGFTINTGSEDENPEDVFDKNTCADLVLEGLRVLKTSKKHVTIEYIISNKGLGPANLGGKHKGLDDNVAFKAVMSSSPRLTRGDIDAGGGYVSNLPKANKGMLDPGESYTGKVKISIRNMTRFTPYIILELDTFQHVRECDETNNKNFVKVK